MNFLGGVGFIMLGFAIGQNYAGRRAAAKLELSAQNAATVGVAVGQAAAGVEPMSGLRGQEGALYRQQLEHATALSAEAAAYGLTLDQYLTWRQASERAVYGDNTPTAALMGAIYGR